MRNVKNMAEVQIVLNELLNWKALQESKALDMHKRQIKNLGAAVDPTDAPTLEQVQKLIKGV